jgi:hypothetical protein
MDTVFHQVYCLFAVSELEKWRKLEVIKQLCKVHEISQRYSNANPNLTLSDDQLVAFNFLKLFAPSLTLECLANRLTELERVVNFDGTNIIGDWDRVKEFYPEAKPLWGFDQAATPDTIEAQTNIRAFCQRNGNIFNQLPFQITPVNPTILLIIAGHGFINTQNRFHLYYESKDKGKVTSGSLDISRIWYDWIGFLSARDFSSMHLVLVVDTCFSGAAVDNFRDDLDGINEQLKGRNSTISIQASCSRDEVARGDYFLSAYLRAFDNLDTITAAAAAVGEERGDQASFPTQNPQFHSSSVIFDVPFFNCGRTFAKFRSCLTPPEPMEVSDSRDLDTKRISTIYKNGSYEVEDVRFFKSSVPGGEYQFVATLYSPTDDLTWNQHIHLNPTTLPTLTIGSKHPNRPVEVNVETAPQNENFATITGYDYFLKYAVDDERECEEKDRTNEVSTIVTRVEEENLPTLQKSCEDYELHHILNKQRVTELPRRDHVAMTLTRSFVTKVQAFLQENANDMVSMRDRNDKLQLMTLGSYMKQLGPNSYHMYSSVKGLTRCRFYLSVGLRQRELEAQSDDQKETS